MIVGSRRRNFLMSVSQWKTMKNLKAMLIDSKPEQQGATVMRPDSSSAMLSSSGLRPFRNGNGDFSLECVERRLAVPQA